MIFLKSQSPLGRITKGKEEPRSYPNNNSNSNNGRFKPSNRLDQKS